MEKKSIAILALGLVLVIVLFYFFNPFKSSMPTLTCDSTSPDSKACAEKGRALLSDCNNSVIFLSGVSSYDFKISVTNETPNCHIAVEFSSNNKTSQVFNNHFGKNYSDTFQKINGTSMSCNVPLSIPAEDRISVAVASDRDLVFKYCSGSFVDLMKIIG